MRRMPRLLVLAIVAVGAFAPTAALAQADAPRDPRDQVILSGDLVVLQGQTVGEVVVFDGDVTVNGVVGGDVIVMAGDVVVAGQVRGDVIVFDGDVRLRSTAQIGRSVRAGGETTVDDGAEIGGSVSSGVRFTLSGPIAALGALLASIAVAVSVLIAGALLVFVAPRGAERVAQAARTAPFASAGIGVGVALGSVVLALAATATIVGLPFGLALLLGLGLVWLVGMAWAAWIVGRLLVREPSSRVGALFAGWAIAAAVGLVPGLNVAWWLLGGMFGLGAMTVAGWRARGTSRHRVGATPPTPT
jgi:cytoskeletal protein CcmA (bactofilin family)